jgi:hypothetical protein
VRWVTDRRAQVAEAGQDQDPPAANDGRST